MLQVLARVGIKRRSDGSGSVTLLDEDDVGGVMGPLRVEPIFRRRIFEEGVMVGAHFMRRRLEEEMEKEVELNLGPLLTLGVHEAYRTLGQTLSGMFNKLADWGNINPRCISTTEVGGMPKVLYAYTYHPLHPDSCGV